MSTSTVRIIKANPFNYKNVGANEGTHLLRVAAYARVSTDSDEQEDSFDRQVSYYTNLISSNPDWKFVQVYSDPGVTGTRADKRPGFMQMMEDCREGKIDKILVKSLARFARNTVDALKYIRELKELGISVFFETHNLDTSSGGGEILLTILAATAEEESRTISKNIKWTYQKKFEKGEFVFNYKNFMGFKKKDDGSYEIVPEEAEIVRRIYREFLNGKAMSEISKELNNENIPTPAHKQIWRVNNIKSILTNEKYYGAVMMGKTFKPDVLSKKRYKNEGQVDSYYVEHALPPIVSKETFDLVQFEMKKREEKLKVGQRIVGKYSNRFTFSKMIRCGCCGEFYVRNCNMRGGNHKNIPCWTCTNHFNDSSSCPQNSISERSIENAFLETLKELIGDASELKTMLDNAMLEAITNRPTVSKDEMELQLIGLQEEMLELHKKKTKGLLDAKEYATKGQKLAEEIEIKRKKLEELESESILSQVMEERINDINKLIDGGISLDTFDPLVFRSMVDSVVVNERTKLTFKFKVGIQKTIVTTVK